MARPWNKAVMTERVEGVCTGPLMFRYQDATYVPPAKSQSNKICSPTAPTPKIPLLTPEQGEPFPFVNTW